MHLRRGLRGSAEMVVGAGDTAEALGSGDVGVLGTPAVVALCERAAVAAVAGYLEEGSTTVGVHVSVDHLAPTLPGGRVRAIASLESVQGRTLDFAVEASDESGVVARGLHTRVLVRREEFLASAGARQAGRPEGSG